jgi:hypothetical protein
MAPIPGAHVQRSDESSALEWFKKLCVQQKSLATAYPMGVNWQHKIICPQSSDSYNLIIY